MKRLSWLLLILLLTCLLSLAACDTGVDVSGEESTTANEITTLAATESTTPLETKAVTKETESATETESHTVHIHVYDRKDTDKTYLSSEADCTSAALYYYSCECGECGEKTFADGEPVHVFDQENTDVDYLKYEATCQKAATYYYSCKCGERGMGTFQTGSLKPHDYTASVVNPTCNAEGYTIYSCDCGYSYKGNQKQQTYDHDFHREYVEHDGVLHGAYVCSKCSLEAIEHGNADGTLGSESNCKYYVTGKYYVTDDYIDRGDYEIVIYGKGAMPDFDAEWHPLWHDYLSYAKKITIAEGITTIGAYAFYDSNSEAVVEYVISDTVKTIKPYALGLKTYKLVLGASVQRIEYNAIYYAISDQMWRVYLPKSVTYIDNMARGTFFYEGSAEEFYKIKTRLYSDVVPLKEFFEGRDVYGIYVYVNAEDINDSENNLNLGS
ncbi:MAG: hypothetical protein E7589_03040 [Ruminococcaceae bacterium]|nr:hypothetical protein [Oscillospiraceae bacterium]